MLDNADDYVSILWNDPATTLPKTLIDGDILPVRKQRNDGSDKKIRAVDICFLYDLISTANGIRPLVKYGNIGPYPVEPMFKGYPQIKLSYIPPSDMLYYLKNSVSPNYFGYLMNYYLTQDLYEIPVVLDYPSSVTPDTFDWEQFMKTYLKPDFGELPQVDVPNSAFYRGSPVRQKPIQDIYDYVKTNLNKTYFANFIHQREFYTGDNYYIQYDYMSDILQTSFLKNNEVLFDVDMPRDNDGFLGDIRQIFGIYKADRRIRVWHGDDYEYQDLGKIGFIDFTPYFQITNLPKKKTASVSSGQGIFDKIMNTCEWTTGKDCSITVDVLWMVNFDTGERFKWSD